MSRIDPSFLVFSDDWGEHPSSCQHLFKIIAQSYPVLWVNTVGLRTPRPTRGDLRKAVTKVKKMFAAESAATSLQEYDGNLDVLQPVMLPFAGNRAVQAFNRQQVVSAVKKKMRVREQSAPIMVITAPNAHDYIGHCGESRCVYYSVDDFSEWPGLDKDLVARMETELIRKADRYVATSQLLIDRIAAQGGSALLLTHGVDVDFFAQMSSEEHPLLKQIPHPRVGYFGLFDDRSDCDLLAEVAARLPDVSFVVTGEVQGRSARLEALDNFYFTGPVPYRQLPAVAEGFSVCMLPYKINRLTDAIQPLKIKEYLATGKPVISTPLKETLKLSDYLENAATAEQWQQTIRSALKGVPEQQRAARQAFLSSESWQEKSRLFLRQCLD
ncbi:MAG: hypothetical protein C0618_04750 [Desulfuromonas sp.]|nr:MAG: hypothetical protein C0618_04750 [Desulfuromonas sp.]